MRASILAVVIVLLGVPALAQVPSRGWLDVSFVSVRPQQDVQVSQYQPTIFGETATFESAYPQFGSTQGLDLGGGLRFGGNGRFGVGLRFNPITYEYQPLFSANVPHPTLFNRYGTDVDISSTVLERKDLAVDIMVSGILPTPDAWQIRVFGGPTYFRANAERISIIEYNQLTNGFGLNSVDVTGFRFEEVDGSAWGFNAGVDVGYFFTRYVGVGGLVRFNRATVTIEDPLSGDDADLKAGATYFGGGVRFRF